MLKEAPPVTLNLSPVPEHGAVTIEEAVALTGLTKRALQGRLDRGSLPHEKRGHLRWIPLAELERQGLLTRRPAEIADERVSRIVEGLEALGAELARVLDRHRAATAELRAELAQRTT